MNIGTLIYYYSNFKDIIILGNNVQLVNQGKGLITGSKINNFRKNETRIKLPTG